jgi:hypothetical protein
MHYARRFGVNSAMGQIYAVCVLCSLVSYGGGVFKHRHAEQVENKCKSLLGAMAVSFGTAYATRSKYTSSGLFSDRTMITSSSGCVLVV